MTTGQHPYVPRRLSQDHAETFLSEGFLARVHRRIANITVDRSYDIPYLAGYSEDGETIYIDRLLPQTIELDGLHVDPVPFLLLHEVTEKLLEDEEDFSYQTAHRIATHVEKLGVEDAGHRWMVYTRVLDGYIRETEHEDIKRVPADLDLKPYEDSGDSVILRELRQHMKIVRARQAFGKVVPFRLREGGRG